MSLDVILLFVFLFSTLKTWLWHSSFIWLWVISFFMVGWYYTSGRKKLWPAQSVVLVVLLSLITGIVTAGQIGNRLESPDRLAGVYDGLIQIEISARFLLEGKNPYAESYEQTQLANVDGGVIQTLSGEMNNPALWHAVYLPGTYLIVLPVVVFFEKIYGWFDLRILLFILYVACLTLLWQSSKNPARRNVAMILFGFYPLQLMFFFGGRNNLIVFFWLLASWLLLQKNYTRTSAALFGLALATKQFAWLLAPFYFAHVYYNERGSWREKIISAGKKMWPCVLTLFLVIGPFLLWDAKSLIEDVYLFPSDALNEKYAIAGYGLSVLLYQLGVIQSAFDAFPFGMLQLIAGIPLLSYLLYRQRRTPSIATMITSYGVFLLVFLFFSRVLQDDYIAYIGMLFIAAYVFNTPVKKDLTI